MKRASDVRGGNVPPPSSLLAGAVTTEVCASFAPVVQNSLLLDISKEAEAMPVPPPGKVSLTL